MRKTIQQPLMLQHATQHVLLAHSAAPDQHPGRRKKKRKMLCLPDDVVVVVVARLRIGTRHSALRLHPGYTAPTHLTRWMKQSNRATRPVARTAAAAGSAAVGAAKTLADAAERLVRLPNGRDWQPWPRIRVAFLYFLRLLARGSEGSEGR